MYSSKRREKTKKGKYWEPTNLSFNTEEREREAPGPATQKIYRETRPCGSRSIEALIKGDRQRLNILKETLSEFGNKFIITMGNIKQKKKITNTKKKIYKRK